MLLKILKSHKFGSLIISAEQTFYNQLAAKYFRNYIDPYNNAIEFIKVETIVV